MRAAGARRVGRAVVPAALALTLAEDVSAETRAAIRAEFGAARARPSCSASAGWPRRRGSASCSTPPPAGATSSPSRCWSSRARARSRPDLRIPGGVARPRGAVRRPARRRPGAAGRRGRLRAAQRVGRPVADPAGGAAGRGAHRGHPRRREPRAGRRGRRGPGPAGRPAAASPTRCARCSPIPPWPPGCARPPRPQPGPARQDAAVAAALAEYLLVTPQRGKPLTRHRHSRASVPPS